MERDELWSLCEKFVQERAKESVGAEMRRLDPSFEILRSYQLAEISESEKNSLLVYICDSEDGPECGVEDFDTVS
jgi:hypothetical protein